MMNDKRRCMSAYIFLFAVCLTIAALTSEFVANDGFWHMAVGRHMFRDGSVPHTAIGAWGGDELSWLPQEWLYQLLSYVLFRDDMVLYCMAALCLVGATLFLVGMLSGLHRDIFRKPWSVLVYLVVVVLSLRSFIVPRPQTVSLFLAVLFVYLLRRAVLSGVRARDYAVFAAIGLSWANMHAGTAILGYLIPVGVVICYMVTDKFPVFGNYFGIRHSGNAVNQVSWIACVMLGTCFCTPNGIEGFLYPMKSMGDGMMLDVISEWAQPNVNDVQLLLMYYVPFFAFYGWLFFSRTKMELYDFIVIGFLFVLGILHMRLVLYLLPVLLLLWIPYLPKSDFLSRFRYVSGWLFGAASLVMLAFSGYVFSMNDLGTEGYGRTGFFDVVRENSGDRLYNFYDIGSILQYYDIPVFVDARYDPFSDNRMQDFVVTQYDDSRSGDFQDVMDKYDFTSILDKKGSSMVLWAADNGYVKMADWDTGVTGVDSDGEEVSLVYEFWVKE